jgi:hypothetical protein
LTKNFFSSFSFETILRKHCAAALEIASLPWHYKGRSSRELFKPLKSRASSFIRRFSRRGRRVPTLRARRRRARSDPRGRKRASAPAAGAGFVARAFARRFGTRHLEPEIVATDAIASELGEWARGYALDHQLSGAKARGDLGWSPRHLDPEGEIVRLS